MITPDNIFAEALERLHNGETSSQIAQDYKDYQQELEGLLAVAEMGLNIPKLTPPAPYKRQLFAEKLSNSAITSSGFMNFMQYMRFAAIPLSLVIALIGGRFAVNATENSMPGDKLYSIKRATEEARLTLTRDQEKVATLHVELLQKRLEEVRKAADSGNVQGEAAAIAELKTQTEKTFAEVATVATVNAISKQDSSLLDTLVAVNKEKKNVLAAISETSTTEDSKMVASIALEDSKRNDMTLAKMIATVNDQALAEMPNKISVTGDIASHLNNRITVEKNTFIITDKTTIIGTDGQPIVDAALIKGRVTITGTRIDNGNPIAKQIQIMPDSGIVKGDISPTKPVQKPVTPTTSQPNTVTSTTNPVEPEPEPTTPPQTVGSGYITEPSSPQYSN